MRFENENFLKVLTCIYLSSGKSHYFCELIFVLIFQSKESSIVELKCSFFDHGEKILYVVLKIEQLPTPTTKITFNQFGKNQDVTLTTYRACRVHLPVIHSLAASKA